MTTTSKIVGLHDLSGGNWDKLVYLHSNSNGDSYVNGEPADLRWHRAGEAFEAGDYFVITPRDFGAREGHYIAVGGGECLLKLAPEERLHVCSPGFAAVSAPLDVWRTISAGVLTVSDKASRGERIDTAGPVLKDMVEALGAEVKLSDVVLDDRNVIAGLLRRWADEEALQLILTTGGTGLSPRDVTPEAFLDVHDRLAPGFGEAMRSRSMLYTPRGFLTRSIAVTRGRTLLISFPGSERAVRQCFEAIAPALRHGVEILNEWDAECGSHSHHHG